MKKLTTQEFIKRAKKIHGNYYDYSRSNYINKRTKIQIVCKLHGEFIQYPEQHTKGHGCKICGIKKSHEKTTYTNNQFIALAKKIHKDKFDYSKVKYISSHSKVIVICKKHGEFQIKPYSHLQGHGCAACSGLQKYDLNSFLKKANQVHSNKYDYSKVIVKNSKTKIKIKCNTHGYFYQQLSSHLKGHGCPKCQYIELGNKTRKTLEDFLLLAKEVHEETYDYSKVEYKGTNRKVKILCKKHGIFEQTPKQHYRGNGCPKCFNKKEGRVAYYLFKKAITHREYKINNKRYDFYVPEYNLIIERDGEQHYRSSSNFASYTKKDPAVYLKEQVRNDKHKTKLAKKEGFKIARIPYWLTKKEEEIEIENILAGKPTYPDVPDLKQEKTKPRPKKNY